MFNVKKLFMINKLTIAIIILALLLVITPFTYSRFFSSGKSDYNIDTAYYVLGTDYNEYQIHLDELLPSDNSYVYTFRILNNKDNKRVETKVDYTLKIVTTTNLPLSYSLFMNERHDDSGASNIIVDDVIERDDGNDEFEGAYFRTMTTNTVRFGFVSDEHNDYQLVINFPSSLSETEYQEAIEGIFITIDSKQVIE